MLNVKICVSAVHIREFFWGIAQFADYLLVQFAVVCQLRKTTHLETYRGYASVRFVRETTTIEMQWMHAEIIQSIGIESYENELWFLRGS